MPENAGGEAGITQTEYDSRIPDRLMPPEIRVSLNGILRLVSPTKLRPPFAFEVFGTVVNVEADDGPAWSHKVSLECDDEILQNITVPVNEKGFVVRNNTGTDGDESLPEEYFEVGYLLGSTGLTDSELTALVEEDVPVPA